MDRISTFNCRSVRKNVHIVKYLCENFNVVALQETFLPQQESNFLDSIHPNFNFVASSPVDLSQ